MLNKKFDDILKHKLDSIQLNTKSDWDVFSKKLDNTMLNDAEFDQHLAQKLGSIQSPTLPDWDAFSQKLTTESFDDSITDKLKEIDTSQVSEHWLLLKDRLENILYFKEQLFSIKLFESFLIVALLVTFINISPVIFKGTPVSQVAINTQPIDNTLEPIPQAEKVELVSTQTKNNASTVAVKDKSKSQGSAIVKQTSTTTLINNNSNIMAASTSQPTLSNQQESTAFKQTPSIPKTAKASVPPTQSIEKLALHGLVNPKLATNDMASAISEQAKDKQINVHVIGGLSNHFVHIDNPDLSNTNKHAFFTQTISSQVGFLVSKEHSKWSVESGVLFSKRSYTSIQGLEVSDNLISIPVNMKYYTNQYNKWSVFALAGITGTYMGKSLENPIIEKSTDLINYTYLSMTGGVGVQYRPTGLASFYAQAQYTSDLNKEGLGTSKYQYDALGLTIGMKLNPFTFRHRN